MSAFPHCDYVFANPEILEQALTHRSYSNEHTAELSNDRMVFFGESILSFLAAEFIYNDEECLTEREVALLMEKITGKDSLVRIARKMEVGERLKLGNGEEKESDGYSTKILPDAVKAVIAAFYEDGGMTAVKEFIGNHIQDIHAISSDVELSNNKDFKSELQILTQKYKYGLPSYQLISEKGPAHEKEFMVEVNALGKKVRGIGNSKKQAEQDAAKELLLLLHEPEEVSGSSD